MPPSSTRLWQEGAHFKSMKIVENNIFREDGINHQSIKKNLNSKINFKSILDIIEAFNAPGKFPNCSGSRNISDNISDLKAQISANNKVF